MREIRRTRSGDISADGSFLRSGNRLTEEAIDCTYPCIATPADSAESVTARSRPGERRRPYLASTPPPWYLLEPADGVRPEVLTSIAARINGVGQDPRAAIMEAVRSSRVIALGETHVSPNGLRQDGLALIGQMRRAGVTHLAVEVSRDQQGLLDDFLHGRITRDEFKTRFYRTADHRGHGDDWLDIMQAAHRAGMRVVAVDDPRFGREVDYRDFSRAEVEWRDTTMATMIGNIIRENPNARVLFWVGANHLQRGTLRQGSLSAGELLHRQGEREGFGVSIFAAQLEDRASSTAQARALAGMASQPVAFRTRDVPNYATLPGGAGQFDNVILYPREYSLRLMEQQYGRKDPRLLPMLDQTALAYARDNDVDQALALQRRAMAIAEATFGRNSPQYVERLTRMGEVYETVRNHEQARLYYGRAVEAATALHGQERQVLLEPAARLEYLNLSMRRRPGNTGAALEQALAVLHDRPDLYRQLRSGPRTGGSRDNPLAMAHTALFNADPHLTLRISRSLLPVLERHETRGSYRITDVHLRTADAYEALGQNADAARHFDAAIANIEKSPHSALLRSTLTESLAFHLRHNNFARAEQLASRQIALLSTTTNSNVTELVQATTNLALAQAGRNNLRQAEENFQLALRLSARIARVPTATVDAYAQFLENNNRRQDAVRLRQIYRRSDE